MKQLLQSSSVPKPIGPYSQAVMFNDIIFTSGQIPMDDNGNLKGDDIKSQTRLVLENIQTLLEDNSSSIDNVIKVTIYLKNMEHFPEMNEVYGEFFGKSLPARSTVEVSRLPKDVLIEIDCVAYRNG